MKYPAWLMECPIWLKRCPSCWEKTERLKAEVRYRGQRIRELSAELALTAEELQSRNGIISCLRRELAALEPPAPKKGKLMHMK